MFKNLIFDLDGTLIDSAADLRDALKQSYLRLGMDILIPNTVIGLPIKAIIKQLTPELDPIRIIPIFRQLYDNSEFRSTHLMEGVDVIQHLFVSSYLLTNKPTKPTLRILEKLHLQFKKVICIDTYLECAGKDKATILAWFMSQESLSPEETIMVGDSEHDIIAANQNKIKCIIVSNGYGDKEKIVALNPYYICDSLKGFFKYKLVKTQEEDVR
jgi:phosphoglycolate phosphatase